MSGDQRPCGCRADEREFCEGCEPFDPTEVFIEPLPREVRRYRLVPGAAEPASPTDGLREELAAYFWTGIGPWERAKEWDREPYWRIADDLLALPALAAYLNCSGCSMPGGRHWDTCPNRHDGRPTR